MNELAKIDGSALTIRELTLYKERFTSRGMVSERAMVALSRAQFSSYMDRMSCNMVLQLSTEILRDKLLEEEQDVPFVKKVPLPPVRVTPRSRYAWRLALAMAALLGLLSPLLTLWMAAAAVAMALIGVVALCEPEASFEAEEEIEVRGVVKVRASSFASFPEATIPYPEDLGPVVRIQTLEQVPWR